MGRLVEAAHRFGGTVGKEAQRYWREDLLSKKEVAEHLGRCERTIERYMKMGMPYYKPHGTGLVRFSAPAIDAWISTQGLLVA